MTTSVPDERFHPVSARRTDEQNTCGDCGQRGSPTSRPRRRHGSRNGGQTRTVDVAAAKQKSIYILDFSVESDRPDRPNGSRDANLNPCEGPDQGGSPRAPPQGATTPWRGLDDECHIVTSKYGI